MAKYISSKKFEGVQYYLKANGTKSYSIRYKDEYGKLKRVKIGSSDEGIDEAYCKNKRIEILNAQNLGEQPPKIVKNHRKKIITLNDIADKYFNSKENTNSTYERLSKYNKHIKGLLGLYAIDKIKKGDLVNLQAQIVKEKGLSKKTANMIIELFSTIFNYGNSEEEYQLVNPATNVKRYKIVNTRERFLKKDEIQELYHEAILYDEKACHGKVLELFTKLAVTTGARTEGILHIKKKDIDLQSGTIRIIDFKRDKMTYSGYVSHTTKELLEEQLKLLNYNDYVVSFNNNGLKISIRKLQYRLKPILDTLFNEGIDVNDRKNRIVIHSLRHTFASLLVTANTNIKRIQELMNHADITQTMKYAKLDDDENKKAIQNIF